MGNWKSQPTYNILMCGCDSAGKTTILYKLKIGEIVTQIPTIGFNIETVSHKIKNLTLKFTVWDVAGAQKLHLLWRHYFNDCKALIWVVDSNDKYRIDSEHSSRSELHEYFLTDPLLKDIVILIFANKQDLPCAMSVKEVQDRLGMTQFIRHTLEMFKSIQQNTLLDMLPDNIINILCDYTVTEKCGPNLSNDHPLRSRILLYDCDYISQIEDWNDRWKIYRLIYEFVPPYDEGTYGTQKQCAVYPCCATTGDGLYEGFEWLSVALNLIQPMHKKKQCIIM
eukprot:282653_1